MDFEWQKIYDRYEYQEKFIYIKFPQNTGIQKKYDYYWGQSKENFYKTCFFLYTVRSDMIQVMVLHTALIFKFPTIEKSLSNLLWLTKKDTFPTYLSAHMHSIAQKLTLIIKRDSLLEYLNIVYPHIQIRVTWNTAILHSYIIPFTFVSHHHFFYNNLPI